MYLTIAAAAALAGFVHVLSGPDHLAAIAPYAVHGVRGAWKTGVRWGVGHSSGVFAVGLLAMLARHAIPLEAVSATAERGVGVVLTFIGAWALYKAFVLDRPYSHGHAHGREAFAVGTVHGLAGSSHLLGILPALALPSDAAAALYLALFGAGTIVAMGTFSSLVGWAAHHARIRMASAHRWLLGASGAGALAVGAWWLSGGAA